jgi:hypothetical protein
MRAAWHCGSVAPICADLQQNSGQSQGIGTRGAPSVPLKERADLQPG